MRRGYEMKTIFTYARLYKKSMVIAIFLMAVELIVELIQPIIMATIIDEGVVARDMPTIITWGGVLIGISLLAFAAGIASSYFASEVSQGVGFDLRRDLFSHVQMFSANQMQKFTASTLLTRITNDVTQVQAFLFTFMRIMLRAPLFIIGGIIMSFTVHVKLAFVLFLVVPILLVIMFWIMKKGISMFEKVQKRVDRVNGIIRETLLGIRLIKAYNQNRHEKQRFSTVNNRLKDENKKALRLMELTMPIVILVMNSSMVALLWFGSIEIGVGQAEPGEIVAILNYATRIMGSFGVFSFLLMSISRGRASASRIKEVLESEQGDITNSIPKQVEIKGDIDFREVTFSYPDANKETLKDITLSIHAGSMVGILGETGSGKSTLLHLIPRLYPITKGELMIDGESIDDWGNGIRRAVTLVPQEGYLFSGTIRENIAWGNEHVSMDRIIEAAKEANLHSFIMDLPHQYETLVGQRGVNLSGGQKQRLSIARALVVNPSILLLDDSTSALDARTEAEVLQTVKSRACTTLLVAQKISSVIDADQIIVMERGKIVATGNHRTLLDHNELYQRIYQSQMKEEGLKDVK